MGKYVVVSAKPVLRVRNAENRNARRLQKRITRVLHAHHDAVRIDRPNGTIEYYRFDDIVTHTVKREAERDAKRNGSRFFINA